MGTKEIGTKKELREVEVREYEYTCDGCGLVADVITSNFWTKPEGWKEVYLSYNILLECPSCYEKRKVVRESEAFKQRKDLIKDIMKELENHYHVDEEEEIYANIPKEPEDVNKIFKVLEKFAGAINDNSTAN